MGKDVVDELREHSPCAFRVRDPQGSDVDGDVIREAVGELHLLGEVFGDPRPGKVILSVPLLSTEVSGSLLTS